MTLTLLSLLACADSNDDVVRTSVSMRAARTAHDPAGAPLSVVGPDETAIVLDEAWVNLRDLQLDVPSDEDLDCDALADELTDPVTCSAGTLTVTGPFVADLLTGTSEPSLDDVSLAAGTYERLDARVDDAEHLEAGDVLAELALLLRGELTLDGAVQPFELALQLNEDIRFEGGDGVQVDGQASGLLAALDVSSWLAEVPLAACIREGDVEVGDDGVARIDEDTSGSGDCSDVEDRIREHMKEDGQLDARG